jgi:hypothetical protein
VDKSPPACAPAGVARKASKALLFGARMVMSDAAPRAETMAGWAPRRAVMVRFQVYRCREELD